MRFRVDHGSQPLQRLGADAVNPRNFVHAREGSNAALIQDGPRSDFSDTRQDFERFRVGAVQIDWKPEQQAGRSAKVPGLSLVCVTANRGGASIDRDPFGWMAARVAAKNQNRYMCF